MAPTPQATERMTARIFAMLAALVSELKMVDDQDGLQALPPVVLTSGVIALCQSLPNETVAGILEKLRQRVLDGDFDGLKMNPDL